MKNILLIMLSVFIASCSGGLKDVKFDDNPYDNDYNGDPATKITSIDTVMPTSTALIEILYDTYYAHNEGVRLYRNGVKVGTFPNQFYVSGRLRDNIPAVSGATYTYEVRLYLGSGEAKCAPVVYTVP